MRRDVLIICVSAGKSMGEIAWRKCEGHIICAYDNCSVCVCVRACVCVNKGSVLIEPQSCKLSIRGEVGFVSLESVQLFLRKATRWQTRCFVCFVDH